MLMARRDQELIDKGRKALIARLSMEQKHADDEGLVEQFLDAESTIEQYLDAVAQGSTSLPESQDLAFACALLLVTTKALEESDMELLGRLNAPEVGVSIFAVSRQVEDMKTRAIARLEKLAELDGHVSRRPSLDPSADGDVPF